MFRKAKILGIKMDLTRDNVQRLAADLSDLQADVFRQTRVEHYLDHDPSVGHTNFELNKFGLALQQAIKADLRAHPKSTYLEFYIQLMLALYDMRNYEIAARVHAGINDALTRDHCEPKPGQYELPPEDKKIKRVREALKSQLEALECAGQFLEMRFPIGEKARTLYHQHIEQQEPFVPMIEILFKAISMILEGDKLSASDVKYRETRDEKAGRLMGVMNHVSQELNSIVAIIRECLPKSGKLYFSELRKKFKDALSLNLNLEMKPVRMQLHEMLNVNDAIAEFNPALAKVPQLSLVRPVVSPRGKIKFQRSPRKTIKDGDSFESPRTDGAVSPRAVSPRTPRTDDSRTEDLYSPRSLDELSPRSPSSAAASPRLFSARSPRVISTVSRHDVAQVEMESSSSDKSSPRKDSLR